MSSHDDIPGEDTPDEHRPTDPGEQESEPEESTDSGTPQHEIEANMAPSAVPANEPTDPGGPPEAPSEDSQPLAEEEAPTDPGASDSSQDEDFSSSLVAIILIVAMVVFAIQGDHKDKAWIAMVEQVEAWTGLDFSEPKWGFGGEKERE